ncbi:MAG: DUF917 domain-containing protein [Pseudomonadota bacterium]|nr:DUF917 domain-containing protein [Pseudomonadota bacterium]
MSAYDLAKVTPSDLKALVYGACFCASGGGGPISMALNFLTRITVDLPVVRRSELSDGKKALILADMGSPEAATQGLGYTAPVNVYYVLSHYLKTQGQGEAAYLMPIEIGAVNSLIPFYIASQLATPLPVIDADPSGRSVPQLNETLLDLSGQAICPAAVASDTISTELTDGVVPDCYSQIFSDTSMSATELEAVSRKVVSSPEYQQVGGLACYPLDSSWLNSSAGEEALVERSLSTAVAVGHVILNQAASGYDVLRVKLAALLTDIGVANYQLLQGTLSAIDNRTSGGFDVGRLTFTRADGSTFLVFYKNESLLAWDPETQKPLVIGPDCINLMLTADSGDFSACTPLSTADISEGMEIAVWGTACSAKMRNSTIEALFQQDIAQILQAFPEDNITLSGYQPIESLN